jgi:O-antigen/teichoic acid export membrane protein
MPPINASFGPYVAHLHHRGDAAGLRQTYGIATSWIVRLSLPAFVALLVYPRDLLHLFGHGFRAGATVTVILAAGKLVDAATGPCGLMLNMSGRPAINMADNISVLILNVLLNLWLIPTHGIVGAAVAWSVSLLFVNVARVSQVWFIMRILPFDIGVLKGLFAGAAGLTVALVVDQILPESALELVMGMGLMLLTYVGVVVALGITREDRMVLRSLTSRVRARTA